jgi:hypothetical protein
MKFVVTLVHVQSNDTRSGTYEGEHRSEAVAKAFAALVGANKAAVIDTWKVLDITEVRNDTHR